MSLRAFHIFFIISVASLFIFLSYWNYMNWQNMGSNGSLAYMGISLFSTLLVIFYGTKFYNKTKTLDD